MANLYSQIKKKALAQPPKINWLFVSLISSMVIVVCVYIAFLLPGFKKITGASYSQLALSFKIGNLYLPQQPSPELLALSNPYDYQLRERNEIEYPLDVSLYNGKFYLYWGPVPSLLLMLLPDNILLSFPDGYVAIAFVVGLYFYTALFALQIWLQFINRGLSHLWLFPVVLLTIGLSSPVLQLLHRPEIYEAAVLGEQFFFIGGCYWALLAIQENALSGSIWKLSVAAFHWAFAIGTRIIVLPATIYIILVTMRYFYWKYRDAKKMIAIICVAGLPVIILLIGLGWYNWVRFGSVFEFGIRYQLALVDYRKFTKLFSLEYFWKNFFRYFVQPYHVRKTFPFLIAVENLSTNNEMAGLLYTSPYALFAFLATCHFFNKRSKDKSDIAGKWLAAVLGGSGLILGFIILVYFYSSMNYAEDFMPSIYLLATYQMKKWLLVEKKNKRYLLALLLALTSLTTSILIAFSVRMR